MNTNVAISCIIPTYNGITHVQKHLPSVFEALQSGDNLIICDDASTDSTVTWLTNQFSLQLHTAQEQQASSYKLYEGLFEEKSKKISVTVVVNKSNVRFGETVNRGVNISTKDFFFLLNNDVSVDKKAISILKNQIASDETIFAVGCLEYENNSSGEKSGKNALWFKKGIFQHSKATDFESGKTAWASGGSAMFSTVKWKSLNGFDSAFYPAYWEDIDVSFRARQRGWKVLFNSQAVVYHKHESTNSTVFSSKSLNDISWKNSFIFAWKNSSLLQKVQFIFWYPYWQMQRMKHSNT